MFQMDASFRKRHIAVDDHDKILNAQTNHTCEKHRMLLDDVRNDIKNDTVSSGKSCFHNMKWVLQCKYLLSYSIVAL